MQDWLQIILALCGGGLTGAFLKNMVTLKSDKRSGNADAERKEIENDDLRFEAYKATIDDLNTRMEQALVKMRRLEEMVSQYSAENAELKTENARLRAENEAMRKELGRE